ncbi:TetR/AcrR family transcriptional regulator [Sporosarcina jeotgali]|uniref:TetR/AcrR family transcriptional regulator n=1 Tax=Sporosarcina jeotgali TaxID=3020056 RepID=A0ABZ0KS75_9BACL|nr:TetR/AcrR family transcriptional regulator [Sporosarcina sp. B2O-1]WOV83020.1 TetR/AcrR family transcriptional regulator [Sporosarcina sp. B2O-1]
MKARKQKEIIESAIKLFAENGFTNTSIQEIVNDCGISKGAFYNYFPSKEALHIAIFEYYFEQMRTRTHEIDNEQLPPREKLTKLLSVPFEQLTQQKDFFMVYMREQSFSINKELRQVMEKTQFEMLAWYQNNLKEVYGEKIADYTGDIIMLIEGIRSSYLVAILIQDLQIDAALVPTFIMNRIDDMVDSFEKGEEPIMKRNLLNIFTQNSLDTLSISEKVSSLLEDMHEQLEVMNFSDEQKEGLTGVIDFLNRELEKPAIEKYTFQGMLANLKTVKEFDIYREKIANLLGLQLL